MSTSTPSQSNKRAFGRTPEAIHLTSPYLFLGTELLVNDNLEDRGERNDDKKGVFLAKGVTVEIGENAAEEEEEFDVSGGEDEMTVDEDAITVILCFALSFQFHFFGLVFVPSQSYPQTYSAPQMHIHLFCILFIQQVYGEREFFFLKRKFFLLKL